MKGGSKEPTGDRVEYEETAYIPKDFEDLNKARDDQWLRSGKLTREEVGLEESQDSFQKGRLM